MCTSELSEHAQGYVRHGVLEAEGLLSGQSGSLGDVKLGWWEDGWANGWCIGECKEEMRMLWPGVPTLDVMNALVSREYGSI